MTNKLFPHGFPQRGEIYKFNFNPTRGKEIRDIHPGLVVSINEQNEHGHYLIVAPITSTLKKVRLFEVFINANQQTGLDKPSKILLNQIRSIDKKTRITEYLGQADTETMHQFKEKLKNGDIKI
ncbi:32033_t:CDS:2, partial [Racocetra persica]